MTDLDPPMCGCGCGEPTWFAKRTTGRLGIKKGDPIPFLNGHRERTLPPRIDDSRYEVSETGCWVWSGKTAKGYGRVWRNTQLLYAHRVSYEFHVGPIPEGMQLDHLCRVRACINPDHLEPVTPRENVYRGLLAKLTKDQVREIRKNPSIPTAVFADRFGVHPYTVRAARAGRTWRGVA